MCLQFNAVYLLHQITSITIYSDDWSELNPESLKMLFNYLFGGQNLSADKILGNFTSLRPGTVDFDAFRFQKKKSCHFFVSYNNFP